MGLCDESAGFARGLGSLSRDIRMAPLIGRINISGETFRRLLPGNCLLTRPILTATS